MSAGNLIDGVYTPPNEQFNMAHSTLETNPWWRVDLQSIHCIIAVNILNRSGKFPAYTMHWILLTRSIWFVWLTTGSPERARNGVITVSMDEDDIFNGDNECARWTGSLNSYDNLISCSSVINGRYVQIQLMTYDYLHFYEVEVHGFWVSWYNVYLPNVSVRRLRWLSYFGWNKYCGHLIHPSSRILGQLCLTSLG